MAAKHQLLCIAFALIFGGLLLGCSYPANGQPQKEPMSDLNVDQARQALLELTILRETWVGKDLREGNLKYDEPSGFYWNRNVSIDLKGKRFRIITPERESKHGGSIRGKFVVNDKGQWEADVESGY
jgi:hypothetical protein